MIDPKYKIGIREAVKLTGKSESTIRRLIKNRELYFEKVKEGRYNKIYLDRNELLGVVSNRFKDDHGQNSSQTAVSDSVKWIEQYSKTLEDQVRDLKERCRKQEERNLELERRIERLNEEIKALLRDTRKRPRGIMGYLVERISR